MTDVLVLSRPERWPPKAGPGCLAPHLLGHEEATAGSSLTVLLNMKTCAPHPHPRNPRTCSPRPLSQLQADLSPGSTCAVSAGVPPSGPCRAGRTRRPSLWERRCLHVLSRLPRAFGALSPSDNARHWEQCPHCHGRPWLGAQKRKMPCPRCHPRREPGRAPARMKTK